MLEDAQRSASHRIRRVTVNETFFIQGPVGRLEAVLMNPARELEATAVVCHAHPLHGGMMHYKVVYRAAKALQSAGLAVLRFNFRGVGISEGVHDDGRGEQEDVGAAIDTLAFRFPHLPIVAGGFSFGSVMAQRAGGADPRVTALFALGFPVTMVSPPSPFSNRTIPRLFVQGEHDRFGNAAALKAFVQAAPEPKTVAIVEGADHFFTGHLEAVSAAVFDWATKRPWR